MSWCSRIRCVWCARPVFTSGLCLWLLKMFSSCSTFRWCRFVAEFRSDVPTLVDFRSSFLTDVLCLFIGLWEVLIFQRCSDASSLIPCCRFFVCGCFVGLLVSCSLLYFPSRPIDDYCFNAGTSPNKWERRKNTLHQPNLLHEEKMTLTCVGDVIKYCSNIGSYYAVTHSVTSVFPNNFSFKCHEWFSNECH